MCSNAVGARTSTGKSGYWGVKIGVGVAYSIGVSVYWNHGQFCLLLRVTYSTFLDTCYSYIYMQSSHHTFPSQNCVPLEPCAPAQFHIKPLAATSTAPITSTLAPILKTNPSGILHYLKQHSLSPVIHRSSALTHKRSFPLHPPTGLPCMQHYYLPTQPRSHSALRPESGGQG